MARTATSKLAETSSACNVMAVRGLRGRVSCSATHTASVTFRSLLSLRRGQRETPLPWTKGLSSSQPDLFKASQLSFKSHTLGGDIEPRMGPRTASTSGLHLLLQETFKKPRKLSSKPGLTTSLVEQRLKESRAKMNEISSRITEISRSNSNLLDVGAVPPPLTAAPQSMAESDDEVDDTAPIATQRGNPEPVSTAHTLGTLVSTQSSATTGRLHA